MTIPGFPVSEERGEGWKIRRKLPFALRQKAAFGFTYRLGGPTVRRAHILIAELQ